MMALSPLWLAFRTVAEGLSARAGLRMAREAGMAVRDATWFRMVGQVRTHYAQSIAEVDRPLNRRPYASEVTPLTSKLAKGYIQYVDLFVRDIDSGVVKVRPQAVRTSRLMSREAVVDVAVQRYRKAVDRSRIAPASWGTDPREVVEGGIYTATQQFIPEG
jgi:hypothetical protein